MTLIKLVKRLKGPLWWVWNILVSCWMYSLIEKANRPGQTRARRFIYRTVATLELLLTTALLYFFFEIMLSIFAAGLTLHGLRAGVLDIWRPV